MALASHQQVPPEASAADRERALRILAKSIFKELKSQGYESRSIVGLATELISLVTSDLHKESESP